MLRFPTAWMEKPRALIVTSSKMLGIARLPGLLSRGGYHVSLLAVRGLPIAFSRHIDRRLPGSADIEGLVLALRGLLDRRPNYYQWIILGDEDILAETAKRREEGWLDGWFPVDVNSPAFDIVQSKAAFIRACQGAGIAIPESAIVASLGEARAAAAKIGYPVLLKAPRGHAGSGVLRTNSENGLERIFPLLGDVGEITVQKLVEGRATTADILFDAGRPVCWYSSYCDQSYAREFGPSCVRSIMSHPQAEPCIVSVGRLLGFSGLCGIDWIEDAKTGSLMVLEFNPRPTPCYHLASLAGMDFPRAMRERLSGTPSAQKPTPVSGPRRAIYMFPQHLQSCFLRDDWADLAHWLPGREIHDIPWDEPALLAMELFRLGYMAGGSILRHLTGRRNK